MTSPAQLYFLHDFRYWTEYLYPYLDPQQFAILRSRRADNSYPGPYIDPANPNHRDVLLAGHSEEKFGAHTRVLVRLQHSPGFGSGSHLHCYGWLANSPRRMMIPRNALEMLRTTKNLGGPQLQLRDKLCADKKLVVTDYDPNLNHFFRAPRTGERVYGSVLIALNWRVTVSMSDLNEALAVIRVLQRNHQLRLVAHPFSKARWIGSKHHNELEAACVEMNIPLVTDLSRSKLLEELDRAEYIVTDGSGSVYEAVARGCKALLLDGLSYQRGGHVLAAARAGGFLPRTLASAIDSHPGYEADLAWLRKLHPHTIVSEDISAKAAAEVAQAYANWA